MIHNLMHISHISSNSMELYTLKIMYVSPPAPPLSGWSLTWENLFYFLTTPSPSPHNLFLKFPTAKADLFSRVTFSPTPPNHPAVVASSFLAQLNSSPHLQTWKPFVTTFIQRTTVEVWLAFRGTTKRPGLPCGGTLSCYQDEPVK